MLSIRKCVVLLALLIPAGLAMCAEDALAGPCDPPSNEIVCENSKPGNPPGEWDVNGAGDPSIQGFSTSVGVDRGETVHFKIDTPSTAYRLDIYRMGYYGGDGARKVASVEPSATLPQIQPPCEEEASTGLIDCGNWTESASWAVPSDAVSGIYFAKLVREDQPSEGSHIVFVVRDDGSSSDLLFQTSDTTWQAYNQYGGNSLYVGGPGENPGRAYKVSYNRPLTVRGTSPEDDPFNAEYPMVRWLERNGYDVTYTTGGDVDRDGGELLDHKAFLSVGHDEYWSAAQRAHVTAARDAGVNLAFFSGNEIFWKTRWENSHRTLVCYKETHANEKIDPESNIWTGTWRDPRFGPQDGNTPENELSGTIFMVNSGTTAIEVPAADGKLRLWRNTSIASLKPGQTATLSANTLGYEWDEDIDNGYRPKGLFDLSSTTAEVGQKLQDYGSTYGPGTATHHLTEYRAPSGALVFSAGTIQWSWGLEGEHDRGGSTPDDRMRQATVNVLADMGTQPQTLQSGLVPATETTDTTPPTSAIAHPADGSKVEVGTPVTITGIAGDETSETEKGGVVAGVEVSVDDGTTWHPAQGREEWSYSWTPGEAGTTTIRARAVDDSGNIQPTAAQATVEIEPRSCPCSIWEGGISGKQDEDSNSVELGLKFRSDTDGFITGVRFYKTAENIGPHSGRLWTAGGTLLGQVTFTNESAAGWQQANFESPIEIQSGTTYLVSYHAPEGHYAAIGNFFSLVGTDNPPLHALADGIDGGNGVYKYGPPGGLFSEGGPDSFEAANYLVDPVFTEELEEDTTPPVISNRIPIAGAIEVDPETPVNATFSEPLKAGTISPSTVELRDSTDAVVEATVSYSQANRRIILVPTEPLQFSSQYTVRIKGGVGGITDLSGNPLAADAVWTFTTAAAPPPPPDEGPGGPILVVTNSENQFGSYYPEILRAEGLNEYTSTDISNLTPAVLNAHDVVLLAQGKLSSEQAQMLSEWVQQGGNLVAMRPDSKLLPLLGLSSAGGILANAYIGVDTSTAVGAGIVGETIQFHGNANRYTTSGAETIASLYSDAATKTSNPAVTMRQVGSKGGTVAAFSYDLARSVIYTRQGNPAWAGEDRDGIGPIRSDDLFFGDKAGDPQPDWVDPSKIAIPQADEQQRLLTNVIGQMNLDRKPLPRFWFLPHDKKAAVVMTGDDHANGGTVGRFEQLEELSPPGCSVTEWECLRSTSYIYPNTPISDVQAAKFAGEGFEIGLHVSTNCEDWSSVSQLESLYTNQLAEWNANFPSLGTPSTSRTHCITWSDWASQPKVELENGIRLDTNYYYWPAEWVKDRPGLFTGSGMPMRFADRNGSPINVYQATTQMTDESGQSYPGTIDALLDGALGPKGYYGVFTANMHNDVATSPDGEAVVNAAVANGVPVVSAKQMLNWLDGRNQSSFGSISWAGGILQFNIDQAAGANGLRAMVPKLSATGELESVKRGTTTLPLTMRTVKGVEYAFFDATSGSYTATYSSAAPPPPSLTATTPASPANNNNPKITGAAIAGTTVNLYAGAGCAGSPVATGTAAQLATGMSVTVADDSTNNFSATAAFGAESVSGCSAPIAYVEDSTAPNSSIDRSPSAFSNSTTASFSFSGTDVGGGSVDNLECRRDGGSFAPCSSPLEYSGLAAGSHTFEVRAIDHAGNVDQTPASFIWTIDTTAPTTSIDSGPTGLINSANASFEFSGTDTGGSGVASFECSRDGAPFAACTTPQAYSGLADGSHSFEVRAVDGAGNVDPTPASSTWRVDTTAPDTSIDSGPSGLIDISSASLTFSGSDTGGSGVATFQCRLDSSQATDWAACTSPASYSSLADGSHTFEVRAVDTASNVDQTPASSTWTIDTTAPTTSIDSGPSGLINSANASFGFSGSDGGGSGVTSFECRRDGGVFAACTSPQAYSSLADGSHTFEVRAIDAAGNVDQSPASSTWTIDTTAPTTSIDSGPSGLINSSSADFGFSGSDSGGSGVASFQCRIDSTQAADWGACASPKSLSSLTDGSHTFEVRAIDAAGNVDQSPANSTWTIDTTAPTTSIDSGPSGLTNNASASFGFSGADTGGSGVASFQCRIDGGAFAACTSPQAYSSLADGSHTFEVRAIDAAGNVDQSPASSTWTIDTTAPTTSIDSGPSGLINSANASFGFSGSDTGGSGVTSFECRRDGGVFAACTSPQAYSSLADGSHTFEVRAIDAAGNVDQSPASSTWTIDTTAPTTSIDSGPSGLINSANASFGFSGSDTGGSGVTSFECRRDGGVFAACTSPQAYSSLADGSHTFEVRAIDAAGNVDQSPASSTWTIDTTAPTTSIDSGPSGLINSANASFGFSGSDTGGSGVTSFECRRDGGAFAACTSPQAYSGLADGSHTFEVRAIDQAGNVDQTPASSTWTIDTTAPTTSIDSGPPDLSNDSGANFTFSGTDPGGSGVAGFECRRDGGSFVACTSPQAYSGLADGSHTFEVRAIDQAGNVDQTPASSTWTIDTTAPTTSIDSGPSGLINSANASFGFSGTDGGGSGVTSFECRRDGGVFAACTSPQAYSSLADGSHTFEVRAIDAAGNVDQSPASSTWTIDTTAPTTSIDSGPSGLINSSSADFGFSGSDSGGSGVASFQCRIDSTQAADWGACASPKSLSSLTDGSHTFEVRAVDTASNVDQTPASSTWTIDTTAPTTSIDSGPSGLINSANASFGFSGSDGGGSGVTSFECRRDGGVFAACTSPQAYSSLADGSHTFEVRAIDAAGNVDQSPASSTWTIDTTAPTTSIDSGPSGLINSSSADFGFSGSDSGGSGVASFQCRIDSTQAADWGACASPKSLSSLTDGSHTFEVRAIDAAGNVDQSPASSTWTIDTTAPTTSIDSGPSGLINSANASFGFSGSDTGGSGVTSFECRRDGGAFAACTSPQAYSGLADGSHTFEVRAIDQAGNVDQTPASSTWTIDTTAPTTSIDSGPPDLSNDSGANFTFSGTDPGGSGVAGFECRRDGGSFVACTSPQAYSGLADGSHTFEVRAIDQAGNVDQTPASSTWTIDTTAPTTSIDSGPSGLINSANASFGFSGTDGGGSGVTSFECRRDGGVFAACTSPQAYSSLADGSHTFEVRAIDAAGNVDQSPASSTWTIDTTAPTTSIDSGPSGLINSANASFGFSGTDGGGSGVAGFECRRDGAVFAPCTSPQAYSGLADGSHTFEVRAIDDAGNVDQSPANSTWIVDTTAPTTSIDSGPSGLTNNASASFGFSGTDGGGSGVASFQCRLDSTQAADWGACASPRSYSSLTDGSHTFEVRAIDQAGNVDQTPASSTWTIDTTAPTTSIDSGPPDLSNDSGANFTFSGTDPGGSGVAGFECRRDGGSFVACTSPQAYSGLADGSHTFEVRAIDQAGNVDQTPASSTWTIDTTAPTTSIDSGPSGLINSANASFGFSGTDVGGSGVASFQCRLDSNQAGDWGACTSPKSLSSLGDGSHTFEVRAIDQVGNIDATPASSTWTVDTTPPALTIDSGPSGLTNDPTPTFTFSSEAGASFECSIDSGTPSFGPCSGNGTHTPASPLTDGPYTFRVRATDAATNSATEIQGFTLDTSAPPPPELTETIPASPANQNSPEVVGTAPAGSTVSLYTTVGCSGSPITTTTAAALEAGITVSVPDDTTTSFRATGTDEAANPSACSSPLTYVEDSTPPQSQIDSSPPAESGSPSANFTFSGTDAGGSGVASFECRIDGGAFAACTSPQAYSSLTDGSHTFEVRAIDQAGNVDQTPASSTWTIDTTAPDTSIDSGPSGLTNSANASFSFSGSDTGGSGVASFECGIDGGAFAACTSPQAYSGLADGSHTFEVRAIDDAGNVDQSPANSTWTIDTTAPTTSIDSGPSGLINSANASFGFSGTDTGGSGVASFECRRDGGAFAACSTPQAYSALADGSHTFEVRAIDQAGNVDQTPASATWIVDTTPPTVTIDSGPSGLTNDPTPIFTFSSEAGASFECSIDNGTPSFGPCSGDGTDTSAAPLADGPYTFRVRATDAATNSTIATQSFTLDTAAPGAPELAATIPASPANDNSPKVVGSAEAGSTVRIYSTSDCSGSPIATATADELASGVTISVTDDSLTRLRATTTSTIGNPSACSSPLAYLEDSTNPQTQIDGSPPEQSGSASADFSFSGTDSGGAGVASFQCRIDSTQPADWESCASSKSYLSLADGSHTFEVRAIDQAGNVDQTPATSHWTVDTTAPTTSIDSGPTSLTNNADANFAFSGTDAGGSGVASLECRLDSTQPADWGSCSSPKSYSSLTDGSHTFEVRAVDQAGNTDATPAGFTWTVDTTPPTLSIDSGPSGLTNDPTPTFTFSSEAGATFECSIDTGTPSFGPCSGDGTDTPASPLSDGTQTFRVRATDAAGNTTTATRSFEVDTAVPAAPALGSTNPESPANDNSPKIFGSAPAGTTISLYSNANCSGTPLTSFPAADLSTGVAVTVSEDSTTRFSATATTGSANTSPCSAALSYLEDSAAPDTEITESPPSQAGTSHASFAFTGSDGSGSGVASYECRLDSSAWANCTSPVAYSNLADGTHTFEVRAGDHAGNLDASPAHDEWSINTRATEPNPPGPPTPRQPQYLRTVTNTKTGTASVFIAAPGPGRILAHAALASEIAKPGRKSDARLTARIRELRLRQRSIRPVSTSVVGAGEVEVPITLTAIGKRLLRREHALKVRVNVSYVALDGSTTTWKLSVKLVKRPSSRHKNPNRAP